MSIDNKEQQSLKKRFFSSRLFLFILFGITLLVALGYARAYYQAYKINQEIKSLQNEVNSLKQKKIKTIDLLKYVSSSSYVEDQARIELNMKKPGENVLFLNNSLDEKNEGNVDNSESGQFIANPVKWFYYFIHKPLNKEE
ncbi:MAG: septum formation initiator family protein [Candidatus Magasanikbacteria bacterium]